MNELTGADFKSATEMKDDNKKLFIETYGCQMNVADSEVIASVMQMAGYSVAETLEEADAVFMNTCSIPKTGGNCALDPSNARYTCTGYYTRKFSHYKSGRSGNLDGYFKEFRLAELYLNYAEAANEASTTGTVPNDAVDAVNAVRSRVGMPGIPYGLSCDQFRLRIRNERRVELAFEEHRFFDVRRWKILDQTDKVITGMKANSDGSYSRFVVDNNRKAYSEKFLLYPIPGDEAIRLQNASGTNCQNPGW